MTAMRHAAFNPRLPLLAATLALVAALGAASPAAGQTLADYDYDQLTFRGLGLGAGYLWSPRIEDTEQYSLRIDLGYLGPGVRMIPSISYWSSEVEAGEIAELADRLGIPTADLGVIEWSDISLSLDSHFVWSTPLGFLTYLGVGVGLHALNGQGPAIDDTFIEDLLDDVTAGVTGIAGIEFEPVRRLRFFVEGRYTAMTSLRFTTVRGGVQVMFSRGNAEVGVVPPAPDPGPGRAP